MHGLRGILSAIPIVLAALCCSGVLGIKCPEWLSDIPTATEYWVDNNCANANGANATITSCMSTPCKSKCAQALLKWSDADYRSCNNPDPSLNGTMWANALKQCRCQGAATGNTVTSMLCAAFAVVGLLSVGLV